MFNNKIKHGSRVRVNNGERYALGRIIELIGVTDRGGPLWSIELDNIKELFRCPEEVIELWPSDPIDQRLAVHGFSHTDIPYILSKFAINNSDAAFLMQKGEDHFMLSDFIESGLTEIMRNPDYKNVTVLFSSNSFDEPNIYALQRKHFSTVREALEWCRAHYGNSNCRSPSIQTDVDDAPIWTASELGALLASNTN